MRRSRNSNAAIAEIAAAGATKRVCSPRRASATPVSRTTNNRKANGLAAKVRRVKEAKNHLRFCCSDHRAKSARVMPSMNG